MQWLFRILKSKVYVNVTFKNASCSTFCISEAIGSRVKPEKSNVKVNLKVATNNFQNGMKCQTTLSYGNGTNQKEAKQAHTKYQQLGG